MDKYLLLIILANGLIWLRSSYGKFTSGNFVSNLGATLEKFAGKNPYPPFKDFLENVAIPNFGIFARLTLWGELLTALTLTGVSAYILVGGKTCKYSGPLLILGLLTGMFLNAIFWMAAGYTSPSTDSLNILMFVTQGLALAAVLKLKVK